MKHMTYLLTLALMFCLSSFAFAEVPEEEEEGAEEEVARIVP